MVGPGQARGRVWEAAWQRPGTTPPSALQSTLCASTGSGRGRSCPTTPWRRATAAAAPAPMARSTMRRLQRLLALFRQSGGCSLDAGCHRQISLPERTGH